MLAGTMLLAALVAAEPNVFVVPLSEHADEFLVDIDIDGTGDVAVLDGVNLTVYPAANRNEPWRLTFPAHARALDITPHPATGKIAVLAACGPEIRLFGFGEDNTPKGERLFEHSSYLSDGDHPYRNVMVFERAGESLFFLPSTGAIELRTWTGELRERIEPEESRGIRRFEEVTGVSVQSSRIGGASSLEFDVRRGVGNEPAFIEEQWEQSAEPESYSRSMMWSDFDDLDSLPDRWPWFVLQPDVENSPRVRCANRLTPGETHVRIDTTLSDNGSIGPARKYPGMITRLNAELPDFNGDGYTDLLLWNTDRPSVSVSAIARVAVQQYWPIRLSAHLFDPDSGRYTAKPFAALDVRATWEMLLSGAYGSPLRHWVIDDIDADGRTDVAFTVDERTYVRWTMAEDGAYTQELNLPEPIEDLSFAQSLDNTGRITIGLRTKSALHVIDPD